MFNTLMLTAAFRGLVTAGSFFVVGKGVMTGDEYQAAIAAVTGLASIAYGVYTRTTNKQVADTVALPKVSTVVKTDGTHVRSK